LLHEERIVTLTGDDGAGDDDDELRLEPPELVPPGPDRG